MTTPFRWELRHRTLFFACFVLAVLRSPDQLYAQFTEPRTYENAPVNVNEIELGYAYARSNTAIEASLIVAGAKFSLNQGTITYTRYFPFVHRLAWVEAGVPIAGLRGSVTGTNVRGSWTGAGDSSYAFGMLLKGGPALGVAEFAGFTPTTTAGVSLTVTAPTGQYDAERLINLGSNRWTFKPEIALSHPFGSEGKWEVDAYANAYFYTDNTSYLGTGVLDQRALLGFEGHMSYSFISSLWVSLGTRYSIRGDTVINGINQDNAQQNLTLASEASISLNSQNSLVFQFGQALVHKNGLAYTGFAAKYLYTWGHGY